MPAPLPLHWTEHAVNQLAALAEYISLDSPLYAEQTVERIVARLEQARVHPRSGRVVPEFPQDDLRELVEPPYRIIYRIRPDAVEVLAIVHGRQDVRERP